LGKAKMKRTNVVIDEDLVERVKERFRLRSTREAIDFALRSVAGERGGAPVSFLDLEGIGWEGDLDEIRHSEPPPEW
jgi:Arc/MetJ family transcription regulator